MSRIEVIFHNMTLLSIWFLLFSCMMRTSISLDSLALSQSIRDGETLVSASGKFEVGFFSPGNTTNRYLGVWRRIISPFTVVWVANRETPLQKRSGVLKINEKGVLVILNAKNITVWSSNISSKAVMDNPIAQLLDSGNLVLKNAHDSNEDNFLWQSFDYPCDTFMPGMKLGLNLETGLRRFLSSWKNDDDPAVGEYSVKLDLKGYPQFYTLNGSVIKYRAGSWNGLSFTAYPVYQVTQIFTYKFVFNEKELYYEYNLLDSSIISIYTLTPSGIGNRFLWANETSNRKVVASEGTVTCDKYALCGAYAYSICNVDGNSSSCTCLQGFVPKFPEHWNRSNWSNGCVRRTKLECNDKDGFLRYTGMKLPDTSSSWFDKTMNLEDCQTSCAKNCSCTSYANLDIRNGGSGCLLWFGDLLDMEKLNAGGQDIYIRAPNSEHDVGHGNKKKLIGITVGVTIFVLTTCLCIMIIRYPGIATKFYRRHYKNRLRKEYYDLPTFHLSVVAKATENFSSSNKLGEGGFGPVYKGTLTNGQELAVKRLSKKSGQGLEEFKNEVVLIAKLQHRNLVKLLGCCIQGEELMLIYEYMLNKSLDCFIFDETRRKLLDWSKRFNIIGGIARGLLYLHQDSRLRIIHRDLKISNILLDENLNPKISDFGLARILLGDQIEANTNKVAGTYGYMPPEYATHGHFSMKSDVFSYGVMVLEIVSGKKNTKFSDPEHYHTLLGHAWRLWTDERPLELLDEVLGERCTPSDVIRCIQVGLLCVQQRPEDRPDMSSVVLMLNGEKLLPTPKVPAFHVERDITTDADASPATNNQMLSSNEGSFTVLDAR